MHTHLHPFKKRIKKKTELTEGKENISIFTYIKKK